MHKKTKAFVRINDIFKSNTFIKKIDEVYTLMQQFEIECAKENYVSGHTMYSI